MHTDAIGAGLLILRIVIGLTMAAHGYGKFFLGGKIPGTGRWFDSIGMRPGKMHALAAASTEVGSGLLFAAGLLTPIAAAGFVSLMLVAAWTVHKENGFFIVGNGWEYNLILATVGVAVATTGAGRFSVDHLFNDPSAFVGWPGFLIALAGGLLAGTGHLVTFFKPPAKDVDAGIPEKA